MDLNSAFMRQMVPPPEGHTENGPHPLCLKATRATEVWYITRYKFMGGNSWDGTMGFNVYSGTSLFQPPEMRTSLY